MTMTTAGVAGRDLLLGNVAGSEEGHLPGSKAMVMAQVMAMVALLTAAGQPLHMAAEAIPVPQGMATECPDWEQA
jgi:hypothetical protein